MNHLRRSIHDSEGKCSASSDVSKGRQLEEEGVLEENDLSRERFQDSLYWILEGPLFGGIKKSREVWMLFFVAFIPFTSHFGETFSAAWKFAIWES